VKMWPPNMLGFYEAQQVRCGREAMLVVIGFHATTMWDQNLFNKLLAKIQWMKTNNIICQRTFPYNLCYTKLESLGN
jgi:hypothetical protein